MHSLNYTQQGHQGWGHDEQPPEAVGRRRKQELGRSNLHAEEDVSEKPQSLRLYSGLTNLIKKYQELLGAVPPPLSCRKLVRMDLKLTSEFEGSGIDRRD